MIAIKSRWTGSLFFSVLMGCSEPGGLPYTLEFTETGVGQLSDRTRFEERAIGALLPGFEAQRYSRFIEGKSQSVILVRRGDTPQLWIYPTADGQFIERIESAVDPEKVWQRHD